MAQMNAYYIFPIKNKTLNFWKEISLRKSFEKLDVPFAWICVLKPDIRLYGLVFYLLKLQQSASSRAPVKSLR